MGESDRGQIIQSLPDPEDELGSYGDEMGA